MNNLASVTTHPSRDKDMAVQALNNEPDFTSHLDGFGSLRIVNRELVNQIKTRNQRIMELEDKVETLEISLRESKKHNAAEVLKSKK